MATLEQTMEAIENFARENMPEDIVHGWPHAERVIVYARMVNAEVEADWDVVQAAVLLHDIGYKIRRDNHHLLSSQVAHDFLIKSGIDHKTIAHIKECIVSHSRQFSLDKPISGEAKVVFDADGMDLFGPIGLIRGIVTVAMQNKGFGEIVSRLEWRIGQKDHFYSQTARRFAAENSKIIEDYLVALKSSLNRLNP
jgi:HD superfamily phosphodiesterase